MSAQTRIHPTDNPEPECAVPPHPFFQFTGDQASFVQCMDALDSVHSMIELCRFLKLESGEELGLTPKAAFGYHSILLLTQGTLSYVSDRLMMIESQNREGRKRESAYLSALIKSLHTIGQDNREQILNNTAAQMNVTRTAVDQFIGDLATK